jgi:cleavage and polyadenylation specificity factor subunit 1
LAYKTHQTLHHLKTHQVHGTITGLAALRTIDSSIDGLDRLLVSFKDAKLAILEWSRGDIATVSLHTYERCAQMTTGDMSTYVPRLRTDPLSRVALLSLPDDGLAVLPVVQEQSDLDMAESFPR